MVPLTPVTSSMIAAHGYDAAQRVLAVHFNGGKQVHLFQNVDPESVAKFTAEESIGRAFNTHIRGKFEHTFVPVEDDATSAAAPD